MEHRFAILAVAALTAIALPRRSAAETSKKDLARQLFELGIEEYKDKQYDAAVASMSKSYALEPDTGALYALAQSERLAGKCKDATVHYNKLLETTKDEKTIGAVKAQIDLCDQIERGEKPKDDLKLDDPRDAPTIQYRTVYRTKQHSDTLAIALYVAGGVSLGGAATTYLLARSTRDDADHATSLTQYNDLYDRARVLRLTAYTAAGAGLALVGYATYRVLWGDKPSSSEVAIVPTTRGSIVTWATTW
jgi:hypothetical protein